MKDDAAIIRSAYEQALANVYLKFFDAYSLATGENDKQKQDQAETRFRTAVTIARQTRDRAVAILQ